MYVLACQSPDPAPQDSSIALGVLHHPFIISEVARPSFEKGLLLLHSFEYDDAHEAFQEAIAADSTQLMCYWGDVMTRYKALWGLQDIDAGRAIMAMVDSTEEARLTHAKDSLERDFWKGLEMLFGEGELLARNQKFCQHMSQLYEKYPGNEEVAAFYSISLLWSGDPTSAKEKALLSAQVADAILKQNPNHPGALHYKIHAYDNPEFAKEAKQAADLYSKVAPDATHALHMPSHIYLALGLWDDVVATNEASYAASVARIERKNLGDDARGYHSYAWLNYGYIQQGRYREAERLLSDMYTYVDRAPNQSSRSYMITMQNALLAEAPEWPDNLKPKLEIKTDDLSIVSEAAHAFFVAHWAYQKTDAGTIDEQIRQLNLKIHNASLQVGPDGLAMCSSGSTRYAPSKNSILIAKTLLRQMEAFGARLEGNDEMYKKKLEEAVGLESETEYSFGPPDIPLPSFEQYGYWLLTKGQAEEALNEFNKSLERAPKRVNALRGKMNALEMLSRQDEAKKVQEELKLIWSKADEAALRYIASI
jgi:tetratricopeptide (TPR) repeat protein